MNRLLLSLVVLVCCIACSTQEDNLGLVSSDKETLRDAISFSPFTLDSIGGGSTRSGGSINIGILSVRIATKSSGCKYHTGLCDFKWFPKNPKTPTFDPPVPLDTTSHPMKPLTRYARANVKKNSSGEYYSILALDKQLPEGLSPEDAYLQIDDDIYWVNDSVTRSEIPLDDNGDSIDVFKNEVLSHKYFIIEKGKIEYNPHVGHYGGYIVRIKSDED